MITAHPVNVHWWGQGAEVTAKASTPGSGSGPEHPYRDDGLPDIFSPAPKEPLPFAANLLPGAGNDIERIDDSTSSGQRPVLSASYSYRSRLLMSNVLMAVGICAGAMSLAIVVCSASGLLRRRG